MGLVGRAKQIFVLKSQVSHDRLLYQRSMFLHGLILGAIAGAFAAYPIFSLLAAARD